MLPEEALYLAAAGAPVRPGPAGEVDPFKFWENRSRSPAKFHKNLETLSFRFFHSFETCRTKRVV